MITIATLIDAQLSTAKIFTPWSTLASGPYRAVDTVNRYPLAESIKLRRWRYYEAFLVLATIGSLISALLATVISGLYTAGPTSSLRHMHVLQDDWFQSSPTKTGGQLLTDLILHRDVPFPRDTYETLAIAKPGGVHMRQGTLEVSIPAIRGNFNCSVISRDQLVDLQIWDSSSEIPSSPLLDSARQCPRQDESFIQIEFSSGFSGCILKTFEESGPSMYYFNSAILHTHHQSERQFLGLWPSANGYFGGILKLQSLAETHCPDTIGVFGRTQSGRLEDFVAFTCNPFAESLNATVNYRLPDMSISKAPIVDEKSRQRLHLNQGLDYKPALLDNPLSMLTTPSAMANLSQGPGDFDTFMMTLVHGSRGVSAQELSGQGNEHRLLEAINRQYGISFAQYMNAYRTPIASSDRRILEGKLTGVGQNRLMQSAIATHTLAVLLGAILILNVATSITMKTKKVLPKNPCSIAAVASLLADSDFLSMIPEGAAYMTNSDLLAVFDGYVFSMGWWAGKEGEIGKRRFGIDFGTADNLR